MRSSVRSQFWEIVKRLFRRQGCGMWTRASRMYRTGERPAKIVKEKGLIGLHHLLDRPLDLSLISGKIGKDVFEELVEDYQKGKEKVFSFFVGEVMKETKGKGNPKLLNELLKQKSKGKG